VTGCVVCGKSRRDTAPATLSKQGRADLLVMLAADPYCSTDCCKRHHRVPVDQAPVARRNQHVRAHGTQQSYKDGCREDCCRIPENERVRVRRARWTPERKAIEAERRHARRERERERKSVAV
jgi:hypothetical protein